MKHLMDLQIDDQMDVITLNPVSRIDLIKYAGASGDFNPIHTIDKEAERAGLPGIIAHGMWTMGNLSKLFTPYLEEGFIQDYTIRFSGMVFLEDVISLKAIIKETSDTHMNFNVMAVNQDEKKVIKGKISFKKYEQCEFEKEVEKANEEIRSFIFNGLLEHYLKMESG